MATLSTYNINVTIPPPWLSKETAVCRNTKKCVLKKTNFWRNQFNMSNLDC